jgi:5-methylcytosine-specific restriction protein A
MPHIKLLKRKKHVNTPRKNEYLSYLNTPRWVRLREYKFSQNPLCELCEAKGIVRQTDEVHHIIPVDIDNPDDDVIYNYDNLQSLCYQCHDEVHNEINKRKGIMTKKQKILESIKAREAIVRERNKMV